MYKYTIDLVYLAVISSQMYKYIVDPGYLTIISECTDDTVSQFYPNLF